MSLAEISKSIVMSNMSLLLKKVSSKTINQQCVYRSGVIDILSEMKLKKKNANLDNFLHDFSIRVKITLLVF